MAFEILIGARVRHLSQQDIDALVTAFKHRTGIDLTTDAVSPAEAWEKYRDRADGWRQRRLSKDGRIVPRTKL